MSYEIAVDLHLHTSYSDGVLSPKDLVNLCYKNGLKHISVTDHDCTDGIQESIEIETNENTQISETLNDTPISNKKADVPEEVSSIASDSSVSNKKEVNTSDKSSKAGPTPDRQEKEVTL